PSDLRGQLATPLRTAARSVILDAMQRLNATRFATSGAGLAAGAADLREAIEAARPRCLDSTAAARLVCLAPSSVDPSQLAVCLAEDHGQTVTKLRAASGDVVVCHEVERQRLAQVATQLVDHRRDYADLARRLHTRIDVEWAEPMAAAQM